MMQRNGLAYTTSIESDVNGCCTRPRQELIAAVVFRDQVSFVAMCYSLNSAYGLCSSTHYIGCMTRYLSNN